MTINRPGLPGDLPPAETLWARWALVAAFGTTAARESRPSAHRTGHWIDDDGLHLDDGGCTWWVMSRAGEGRYVLYGEDESSGTRWHRPPVDVLAGGPAWLPWEELEDRRSGGELGCVYWYEDGTWARAPYPDGLDDDGLDCGMGELADRAQAARLLVERLAPVDGGPGPEAVLAEAEAGPLRDVDALLARLRDPDGEEPEPATVARALARAGLTPRPATG
ncbi:hypothetical protein [Streptomyces omiyaensis]|uniref:hypothetical protein n=1 Tax=Streptomyces omiyaensis TaxID=68247 RepID=UPI0016744D0D|nr:hypothetical protein [Streptomyces omiyaensis]